MLRRESRWLLAVVFIAVVCVACVVVWLWGSQGGQKVAEAAYRFSIRGLERRIREYGADIDPEMLEGLQNAIEMLRARSP